MSDQGPGDHGSTRAEYGFAYVLDFVFVEEGDHVDDYPGQRAAKIDQLVHDKGHDAGGENVILEVGVPRSPQPLEYVQVDVVLADELVILPVSLRRG